jgi:hypothetical protein
MSTKPWELQLEIIGVVTQAAIGEFGGSVKALCALGSSEDEHRYRPRGDSAKGLYLTAR